MNELYNTNADFRRYVDRYASKHNISVEEALEHKIVKQEAEQYREEEAKVE